jgi:hypothetical protein
MKTPASPVGPPFQLVSFPLLVSRASAPLSSALLSFLKGLMSQPRPPGRAGACPLCASSSVPCRLQLAGPAVCRLLLACSAGTHCHPRPCISPTCVSSEACSVLPARQPHTLAHQKQKTQKKTFAPTVSHFQPSRPFTPNLVTRASSRVVVSGGQTPETKAPCSTQELTLIVPQSDQLRSGV